MKRLLKLTVNGQLHELAVKPKTTLAQLLRNELGLTGTKVACNEGACGSCTVIVDGMAVKSCSVLAVQADGKEVQTIEGLAQGGRLHPIQEAYLDHGAAQCGFCSPGMIMSAKAFLDKNPRPTELQVRRAIDGNLCRCTGYIDIIDAVLDAAKRLEKERSK